MPAFLRHFVSRQTPNRCPLKPTPSCSIGCRPLRVAGPAAASSNKQNQWWRQGIGQLASRSGRRRSPTERRAAEDYLHRGLTDDPATLVALADRGLDLSDRFLLPFFGGDLPAGRQARAAHLLVRAALPWLTGSAAFAGGSGGSVGPGRARSTASTRRSSAESPEP